MIHAVEWRFERSGLLADSALNGFHGVFQELSLCACRQNGMLVPPGYPSWRRSNAQPLMSKGVAAYLVMPTWIKKEVRKVSDRFALAEEGS